MCEAKNSMMVTLLAPSPHMYGLPHPHSGFLSKFLSELAIIWRAVFPTPANRKLLLDYLYIQ
jgi:hypothetical protein